MLRRVRFKMRFICMNCINKFNNKIGGVGIDDKPRNYYRIYFGLSKRKSKIHTLSTYAFIKWTILQGNIDYLIMIYKVNITCMDKSVKIQCRGIWSLAINPSTEKKTKIGLFFILLSVNNEIRHIMTTMNQHHNCHKLQKKTLMKITWPLMGIFTFS